MVHVCASCYLTSTSLAGHGREVGLEKYFCYTWYIEYIIPVPVPGTSTVKLKENIVEYCSLIKLYYKK